MLRKLPYRKPEGGYNQLPVINEASLVAALQQADVPNNQEVLLSIYDGQQTTAPVLIGTFDGDTIVKTRRSRCCRTLKIFTVKTLGARLNSKAPFLLVALAQVFAGCDFDLTNFQ